MAKKIGIIAGGGNLPGKLIQACRSSACTFHVIALEGHADPETIDGVDHDWVRLGAAENILQIAQNRKITDIVLAGNIRRPSLAELRPDGLAVRLLARAALRGDDGILKIIIKNLERRGFGMLGPEDILIDLLPPAGVMGRHAPDQSAQDDIERGKQVLDEVASADIGQAVVVQSGIVLGIEAAEGTDALMERCGALSRDGPGGVLIKLPKRGQERKADLPTIGPATVRNAHRARLRGIAVAAEATLVVDKSEVTKIANNLGLFVVALPVGE